MVTVPATTKPPLPPGGPKPESLSHIDITKLSQSELHALSLCSDFALDLRRPNDAIAPQINPSIFNESAGSRRQTYSRHHHHHHHSSAGLRHRLPSNPRPLPSSLSPNDPERAENTTIVNFLKHLITGGSETELPPPQPVVCAGDMQMVVSQGPRKRKRERNPSNNPVAVPVANTQLEIVNKNGVVVDFKALENGDELYAGEFRRRTVGLESEEQFLGVLGGLEGQWGSRRKKRRIVSACEFGDWLPVGWRLLLALKRKDGRVSVYCRRYISPDGQQFASCKEASSFLQSYFGLNDASQQMDLMGDDNLQVYVLASDDRAGVLHKNLKLVPKTSIPHVKGMEFNLIGIDNLPEVQVRDLFECYKCNMTFDEKNPYLKHLMTFHQRTTKRYRLGSSIGEGVIIKQDGKYECQICHKVFQERRSYNGHVGVHVRNHVRHSEELPGEATVHKSDASPSQDKLPPRISKMDALIEIAQSSILDTSSAEQNDKANGGSSPDRLEVASVPEHHVVNSDHELASDPNGRESEDCTTKSIPDHSFNQNYAQCIISDKEKVNSVEISPEHQAVISDHELASDHNGRELEDCMTKNQGFNENYVQCIISEKQKVNSVDISHVESNVMAVCAGTFEHTEGSEVEKHGNSEQESGLNSQLTPSHVAVTWSSDQTVNEIGLQSGIADSSMTMTQSFDCFPSSTALSNKGEDEFGTLYQKLDNVTGFDELRLEEMEHLQFSFMNGQELPPFPEVSVNVANDEIMEEVFNSSATFQSEKSAS
ncbi:uncharacterized protein LOC131308899 isoform X2 [Rhododendron vialii]|uniref:uncharacterized protein LOC131308899 isoform X2 n=1 Tax=Rhododendron vialii TaxID=182163 RepID=UPI00265DC51E|nr:uncharacterized protein LOC131308899 isoform X2 [Rhododendron vialii]